MSFTVIAEAEEGGRLTSVRDPAGVEWCWSRPDPRRRGARPGARFFDVGGVEECFPTLAGSPDHGAVWCRPWASDGAGRCSVRTDEAQLHRTISAGTQLEISCRLEAPPGYAFIWAFHMLVVPSADLRINLPEGTPIRSWPDGYHQPMSETRWPSAPSIDRFDDLAVDDGSATFVVAPDVSTVSASRGHRTLSWQLIAPGQPVAVGLWRNLYGFSWDDTVPYRSIGIEPMIGRHPDRRNAAPEEAGCIDASGIAEWSLTLRASGDSCA